MTDSTLLARIANGRTDLVWEYVASGHPAVAHTHDGLRLLQCCAYFGDVTAMRVLLHHGESLATLGANLGLGNAAFHGHWQLCEFLLENGADVNAGAEGTGETPLHCALSTPLRHAHDVVVEVLLSHGADPDAATTPGVETEAFMRDCRTKGETPLHRAAAFGSADVIASLLRAGASREVKDTNGDSPLGWASWYARPDAVLRLLCYGTFTVHPQRLPMPLALVGRPWAQS